MMKYCLSGRQPKNVLAKADEIKIEQRDYQALIDYIENYPDKTLILELNAELPEKFDWHKIEIYANKHGDFYCAVANKFQMAECSLRNIKFYYRYQINTFHELEGVKNMGAAYALIGVPLIFDLPNVARYGIPLRAIPNLAYEPYLRHKDGICGGWIRPEDVEAYGEYIDVMEFYAPKMLEKEATLYHIYAENKSWPGNLDLLIEFLDAELNNNCIYDEENFAKRRMTCRHSCMSSGTCHYCSTQFLFGRTTIPKYRTAKRET